MPKMFIEDDPSLTDSDVLSLFLCNDTVIVLLRLGRLLTNQPLSIYYINGLPHYGLDPNNKPLSTLLRASTKYCYQAEK
jgi:hypothetical protein